METGSFSIGCRAVATEDVDTEKMIVEGVLSSEAIDWHGTVFNADATMRALEQYPGSISVMHSTGLLPVGKLIAKERSGNKVRIDVQLSDTELGRDTWQLIKDDVLKGFSIQFARGKSEKNEEGTPVIKEYDMLDITIHPNPSNPEAIIDGMRSKGLFDRFLVWLKGEGNNSGEEPLKTKETKMPDDGSGDRAKTLEIERDKFKDEAEGYRSKFEETDTKLKVLEKEKYEEGLRSIGKFDPAEIETLSKHQAYLEEHTDLSDFIRSMVEARPDTASTKVKTDTTPGEVAFDPEDEKAAVNKGVEAVVEEVK